MNKKVQKIFVYLMLILMLGTTILAGITALF
ncbi:stressosome-associated protein Prli42 [Metabacillus sp. GX 13764]|nr:stressosome-associated protein Prli42 [Metabacillus kandeliae]